MERFPAGVCARLCGGVGQGDESRSLRPRMISAESSSKRYRFGHVWRGFGPGTHGRGFPRLVGDMLLLHETLRRIDANGIEPGSTFGFEDCDHFLVRQL